MSSDIVVKCKWYPRICNHQSGHSGRYCGKQSKCKHQKFVSEEGRIVKKREREAIRAAWN